MRNFYLFMLVFKQTQNIKHFENMFSSGMRKKYKKIETSTFGVDLERLYVFEQETHYRMLDVSEEKVSDNEARLECC